MLGSSYSLRTEVTEQLTPYHGVNDLIINIHNLIKKHIPFVLPNNYTYLYPMKNSVVDRHVSGSIEVLIVLGTFLIGMAVGNSIYIRPSFTKEDDIEMVVEDDDIN